MTEFSDNIFPQPLFYGLISVVVFVLYSVPIFSRTDTFFDIGFEMPSYMVAGAAALVGLFHGLISGAFAGIFQYNSILLSCVLSVVAALLLVSISLVVIWLRDSNRPRGEFAEFYFGWLKFAFIMFFVPSLISGLMAGVLI